MNENAIKVLISVVAVAITAPIWFYLLYFLLKNAEAGELQMALFWVYVPSLVLVHILSGILRNPPKR